MQLASEIKMFAKMDEITEALHQILNELTATCQSWSTAHIYSGLP